MPNRSSAARASATSRGAASELRSPLASSSVQPRPFASVTAAAPMNRQYGFAGSTGKPGGSPPRGRAPLP